MKPYPEYKESGVEWLGQVPVGWEVAAPKYYLRSQSGGTAIKGQCADEPADGLFPGFSASGQDVWLEEWQFDIRGLVLSAVGARCGKTFQADGKWGTVANTHCLFPTSLGDRNFLWYLTNNEDWWEKGGTAQPFVLVKQTLSRPWVFPPLFEQRAIAGFLDREVAKIDALIEESRALIAALAEKRQATISQAVTRGLNPSARLKPSGVDWLGDIPEGWEVVKLSRVVDERRPITYGIVQAGAHRDNGIPYIRPTDMTDEAGVFDETTLLRTSPEIAEAYARSKVRPGDLICSIGPSFGKVMVVPTSLSGANLTQGTARVAIDHSRFQKFFFWVLRSQWSRSQWDRAIGGATFRALNLEPLSRTLVPVPPFFEQQAIADHLDAETARIDALTEEAKAAIALLQERRAALISAAVTGKIDTRDTVAAA